MDIDSDSHAKAVSHIKYEIPEAGKLYAKSFLVQQCSQQDEGDIRRQSPETLSPPGSTGSLTALYSADERDRGVTYDHSTSSGVHIGILHARRSRRNELGSVNRNCGSTQ